MESFFEIIVRSSLATSLFFFVYWLLLRKLTFFKDNRYFLTCSLVIVIIAIFPIQYGIFVENPSQTHLSDLSNTFKNTPEETSLLATGEDSFSMRATRLLIHLFGCLNMQLNKIMNTWPTKVY